MLSRAFYLPQVWLGSQISDKFLPSTIRPLSAHIKFTENCQAGCISCDYWKSRWQDRISTDRAVELLDEISGAGIGTLRLTGGEPLLRKDLFEILHRANATAFKHIILQTNGLLLKKLHKEVNDSPITKVAVSIDGLKESNDLIRGIQGYFDLGVEGIKLLRGKKLAISVTLNRLSADELEKLADLAHSLGADIEFNILSRSLSFLKDADLASMWPQVSDVPKIAKFVRDTLKRPAYETDYITRYYHNEAMAEPPCVLRYLQVFSSSNAHSFTARYPFNPVGNILQDSLASVLASEAYSRQCVAMILRECPGCTCGIESSLAMKHAASSAFFELKRLKPHQNGGKEPNAVGATQASDASRS